MNIIKDKVNYRAYVFPIVIYLLILWLTLGIAIVARHYNPTPLNGLTLLAFPIASMASGWVAKKRPRFSAVLGSLSYFVSVVIFAALGAYGWWEKSTRSCKLNTCIVTTVNPNFLDLRIYRL